MGLRDILVYSFSLILCSGCAVTKLLNSGSVNVKYTVSKAKFEGVLYEEKERLNNVSFSVRNLQHPRAYGKWNFNLKISPSIHLDRTTYQTGQYFTNPDTGNYEQMPNIKVQRLLSFANVKSTAHTPIGAFALSLGIGGNLSQLEKSTGQSTTRTGEARRIDFVFYRFLSKRFFVLLGPRYYKTDYESYVFAFRIGYFWGRI